MKNKICYTITVFIVLSCFSSNYLIAGELIDAMKKWDHNKVEKLLEKDIDINEKDGDVGILSFAFEYRHHRVVGKLIDSGADLINVELDGYSPLTIAMGLEWFDIADLLVAKGALPKLDIRNLSEVLEIASENNKIELIKKVIETIPGMANKKIGKADDDGILLHLVSYHGYIEPINLLIAKGANVNAEASRGYTPLLLAVMGDRTAAAKILINNGANTQYADRRGRSMYDIAQDNDNIELMKLLARNDSEKLVSELLGGWEVRVIKEPASDHPDTWIFSNGRIVAKISDVDGVTNLVWSYKIIDDILEIYSGETDIAKQYRFRFENDRTLLLSRKRFKAGTNKKETEEVAVLKLSRKDLK